MSGVAVTGPLTRGNGDLGPFELVRSDQTKGGFHEVATAADRDALVGSALAVAGLHVFTRDTGAYWCLNADLVTWAQVSIPPRAALAVTDYYLSLSGSDANDGLTSGTPKRSANALQAFLAPDGGPIRLTAAMTWHFAAGDYSADAINTIEVAAKVFPSLVFVVTGTQTVLASGVVATVVARDTQTDNATKTHRITATLPLGGAFDLTLHIGRLIKFTGGTNTGAICGILDVVAGQAWLSQPSQCTTPTSSFRPNSIVTPVVADTFDVIDLPKLPTTRIISRSGVTVMFQFLKGNLIHFTDGLSTAFTVNCNSTESVGTTQAMSGAGSWFVFGGMSKVIRVSGGGTATAYAHAAWQGSSGSVAALGDGSLTLDGGFIAYGSHFSISGGNRAALVIKDAAHWSGNFGGVFSGVIENFGRCSFNRSTAFNGATGTFWGGQSPGWHLRTAVVVQADPNYAWPTSMRKDGGSNFGFTFENESGAAHDFFDLPSGAGTSVLDAATLAGLVRGE